MPRVSVVCATWNWSEALRCAIQSALAQTFTDFEMLVIGDACTDDSELVVESLRDSRLSFTNLPTRFGNQWGPNNEGLRQARGEYVAYLSHDDLWYPSHLATIVETLDRTGADLTYSAALLYGEPGSDGHAVTGLVHPQPAAVVAPYVSPSSLAHRRSLIDKIGYWHDASTTRMQIDDEFLQRAWRATHNFAGTDELTAFKFPAAWRRNIYHQKHAVEQQQCLAQMTEPGFRYRQLLAVAKAFSQGSGRVVVMQRDWAPGELFALNLRLKGADEPPQTPVFAEEVHVRMDEIVDVRNFHAVETNETGSFRWTGPGRASSVNLPLLPGPERELRIRLVVAVVAASGVTAQINNIDVPLAIETRPDDTIELVGRIPANAVTTSEVVLELDTQYTQSPNELDPTANDPRLLGIAISEIVVTLAG